MDKVKLKALTFDDVLLLPSYSDFVPSEASTETKLTKNITLKTSLSASHLRRVFPTKTAARCTNTGNS